MQIFDLFGTVTVEGIEQVSNQMMFLGEKVNQVGDRIMQLGGKLIDGITKPILGFAEAGVQLASDLEEVKNVVDVTFGSAGKAVEAWSQTLLNSYGMVELEALKYVGSMGAMMKSSGLSTTSAETMSKKLVELTGDMSSFYNLSHEEVWEKIRAGISGETEPLRVLGINMSVANLEAYALSQGIKTSWKEMTQAEQTTLRYNYLLTLTADAQGDFARTSTGWANTMRSLDGMISKIQENLGSLLLPVLTKAANVVKDLTDKFMALDQPTKNIIYIVGAIAAVIPILITVFGALVVVAGTVITAIGAIGSVIATIGAPAILVIGLLGAFATVVGVVYGGIIALVIKLGILQGAFEYLKSAVMIIVNIFRGDVASAFDLLTNKFGMSGNEAATFIVKVLSLKDKIIDLGGRIRDIAVVALEKFGAILLTVSKFLYDHRAALMMAITVIINFGSAVVTSISIAIKTFENMYNAVKTVVGIFSTLKDIGTSAFNSIKSAISGVIDKISQIKLPSMPSWMPGFATGVTNFQGGWAVLGEEGPEIVELPKGTNVYSNEVSKTMMESTPREVSIGQKEVKEVFNFNGNIIIDTQNIKDINDLIDMFRMIKSESITRGGI